jgi:aspartate aminotransferase
MLSTLRVTSRQAVARESGMRALLTGVRAGSTWANVPQGPPVRLQSRQFHQFGCV